MTPDEIIKVVEHYKKGGKVQYRQTGDPNGKWTNTASPGWNFYSSEYREAPPDIVVKGRIGLAGPSTDWSIASYMSGSGCPVNIEATFDSGTHELLSVRKL